MKKNLNQLCRKLQNVELIQGVLNQRQDAKAHFLYLLASVCRRSCVKTFKQFGLELNQDVLGMQFNDFVWDVTLHIEKLLCANNGAKLRDFLQEDSLLDHYVSRTASFRIEDAVRKELYCFDRNATIGDGGDTFLQTKPEAVEPSVVDSDFDRWHLYRNVLVQAISRLPKKQRAVMEIVLQNVQQGNKMKEKELAKSIGMSATSFARNKNIAIQKLGCMLSQYADACSLDRGILNVA